MLSFLARLARFTVKASLLLALVAVVVGYSRLTDVDRLGRALTEHVKKSTGRTLSIGGKVGIDLAFPPRLTAEDLRLENAPWGSRRDMMRVRRLEAEIDLLGLVLGDVTVPRVRMVGVDILLETNRNGEGNWEDLQNFDTAAGPGVIAMPLLGPMLGAGTVSLAGAAVTLKDGASGVTRTLTLGGPEIEIAGASPASGTGTTVAARAGGTSGGRGAAAAAGSAGGGNGGKGNTKNRADTRNQTGRRDPCT